MAAAIWRKVQKYGLSSAFRHNENVRPLIRVLMALAFLPVTEVLFSFDRLEANVDTLHQSVCKLLAYFRSYWMRDLHIWNVNGVRIRINNDIELWHSKFSKYLRKHVNIYQFVKFIRDEEWVSRHV
jgi:hypothetical protein